MEIKTLIIIPTYNEAKNIEELILKIFNLNLNTKILIIDDNSPDGTGKIVDELASQYKNIKIIHRPKKLGLGTAYREGFKKALGFNPDYVITMDADFSHDPSYLPIFLKKASENKIIIGSRYIKGGQMIGWEWYRKYLISRPAIFIIKLLLGIKVADCTAGFKCYPRRFLESLNWEDISSQGYAFQVETLLNAQEKGFYLEEIPIIFRGRREGESKINLGIIFEGAMNVFKLTLKRIPRLIKKSDQLKEEKVPPDYYDQSIKENIFQRYYHKKRFKEIIKLIGNFEGKLLDVGCNGGTFIGEIARAFPRAKIWAVDIDRESIEYAKKKHPNINFLVANVYHLPFSDHTFDAITSLEVLEHLKNPQKAIEEIKRCLKPGGYFISLVPTENLLFKFIWFFWTRGKGRIWREAHFSKFPSQSLDNLLKEFGFEVLKRKTFHLGMLLAIKARKK